MYQKEKNGLQTETFELIGNNVSGPWNTQIKTVNVNVAPQCNAFFNDFLFFIFTAAFLRLLLQTAMCIKIYFKLEKLRKE